jgi:hypothetical protein
MAGKPHCCKNSADKGADLGASQQLLNEQHTQLSWHLACCTAKAGHAQPVERSRCLGNEVARRNISTAGELGMLTADSATCGRNAGVSGGAARSCCAIVSEVRGAYHEMRVLLLLVLQMAEHFAVHLLLRKRLLPQYPVLCGCRSRGQVP